MYRIVNEDNPIEANENRTVSMWLQAPHKKGPKSIKVLVYYNVSSDYSKIK